MPLANSIKPMMTQKLKTYIQYLYMILVLIIGDILEDVPIQ